MPDNKYRPLSELLHQLVDIVSLGGNYLLNVGPDPKGIIPPEAQERLRGIGRWMSENGESIHGTNASPFPAKPSWGRITSKANTLYLHVYKWSSHITLTGVKSRADSVTLLADSDRSISWSQTPCGELGYDRLAIDLPDCASDPEVSVVNVRFEAPLELETRIIEDDSGCIQLPACLATLHSSADAPVAEVNITGVVQRWFSTEDWFSWEFLCEHPGDFHVTVTASTRFQALWDFGHRLAVEFDGKDHTVEVEDSGMETARFQKRSYDVGRIRVRSEGPHQIAIRAKGLVSTNGEGFTMSMVKLSPAGDPIERRA